MIPLFFSECDVEVIVLSIRGETITVQPKIFVRVYFRAFVKKTFVRFLFSYIAREIKKYPPLVDVVSTVTNALQPLDMYIRYSTVRQYEYALHAFLPKNKV